MIIWKKKLIECCKCHRKYSFDDNLFYHLKKYILICPNCNLSHEIDIKLLKEKYDRLQKVNKLNLTVIDIGAAAIDRPGYVGPDYTYINKVGAANASGFITSVEIWPYVINLANCEVATFYVVSGTNFSTRDSEAIGAVTAGGKRTFEVNIEVQEGDYIGMFFNTGYMEQHSNSQGYWSRGGDNIPCTNAAFSLASAGGPISLYGTGATEEEEEANAIFFGMNF